ncbi:MAG: SDR family oxidoreductase [Chlorobiaceae bacterium]|jgi:short-subunit dehydrogenase
MTESNMKSVAFITGASKGIGYAIARCIAPACSHLLIASRKKSSIMSAAKRLRDETSCEVHAMWGDLARLRLFADKAKDLVTTTTNHVDLLVLNAGYYVEGSLGEIADIDFERNMLVNCHSAHYVVSALLPFLKKSKNGRIVIIGSTAAYESYPLVPTYGVAKWGLRGYAINLRKELMQHNLGVTFISPGGTLTDMWAGEDLPENRLLQPDDIGKVVAATMSLSKQAVVEELIIRPMQGDIHE